MRIDLTMLSTVPRSESSDAAATCCSYQCTPVLVLDRSTTRNIAGTHGELAGMHGTIAGTHVHLRPTSCPTSYVTRYWAPRLTALAIIPPHLLLAQPITPTQPIIPQHLPPTQPILPTHPIISPSPSSSTPQRAAPPSSSTHHPPPSPSSHLLRGFARLHRRARSLCLDQPLPVRVLSRHDAVHPPWPTGPGPGLLPSARVQVVLRVPVRQHRVRHLPLLVIGQPVPHLVVPVLVRVQGSKSVLDIVYRARRAISAARVKP
eukprot:3929167-Rhodomonas_salina.3